MSRSNTPTEPENNTGSTDPIITFVGDDGSRCSCRIVGIFDLQLRMYALLLKMDHFEEDALVAMRAVQSDGYANFEAIDDDAEFNLVVTELEKRRSEMSVREGIVGKYVL